MESAIAVTEANETKAELEALDSYSFLGIGKNRLFFESNFRATKTFPNGVVWSEFLEF